MDSKFRNLDGFPILDVRGDKNRGLEIVSSVYAVQVGYAEDEKTKDLSGLG